MNRVDYVCTGEVRSNEIRSAGHMYRLHCPQSRVCTKEGAVEHLRYLTASRLEDADDAAFTER